MIDIIRKLSADHQSIKQKISSCAWISSVVVLLLALSWLLSGCALIGAAVIGGVVEQSCETYVDCYLLHETCGDCYLRDSGSTAAPMPGRNMPSSESGPGPSTTIHPSSATE